MAEQNNQKPTEKPPENIEIVEAKKSFLDSGIGWVVGLRQYFIDIFARLKNLEKSNIELGIHHMRSGNFFDAAFRFRVAIWVNKNNGLTWYLLGKSYVYGGNRQKAIIPLRRALKIDPEFNEAKFLLAVCDANNNLQSIPRSFIIEKLDILSGVYDNFLNEIGSKLVSTFTTEMNKYLGERTGINVLELNCRGGELAAIVKPKANYVIGVEPSIKLAGLSRTKRDNNLLVFNFVHSKFPEDYLKDTNDRFDLVICALYFDNLGNLDALFKQIHKVMNPKAALIFNTNKIPAPDYAFTSSALIFGHSDAYIRKLAEANGFNIISTNEISYESGTSDLVYVVEKR